MKKQNLLKCLILVISVLFSTQEAFSQASTVQMLRSSVQPAVAIEKTTSSTNGTIEPSTGIITEDLSTSFFLKINDGKAYDFIIYSTITTSDEVVSAFDKNGNLLFTNNTILPISSAVENAKQNSGSNANVIVYPFELTLGANMTSTFVTQTTYEKCYKINFINSAMSGSLIQSIGKNPIDNTYSIGEDNAGSYKATVYITAISK